MSSPKRVAVVGGGWAGLSAAVRCRAGGAQVCMFEMAPQLGGRARSVASTTPIGTVMLDNGQHILIGAYRATLALMQDVGVPITTAFKRSPLRLVDVSGRGLVLPPGHPVLAFARGVIAARTWPLSERIALLRVAFGWLSQGFTCEPLATVEDLTSRLPDRIRRELIDPLCVAALNTPATAASGRVFLRVMKDALFGGRGSSDLLLPTLPLAQLLPDPARAWLEASGARVGLRSRVQSIEADPSGSSTWTVDGEPFDTVILACSAVEAARLVSPIDPTWSATAMRVPYQSIVTVYAHHVEAQLPGPMVALDSTAEFPAQFVFDHGQLSGRTGLLAFVISGANEWLQRGLEAATDATLAQARQMLPDASWVHHLAPIGTVAERRATFACLPSVVRPAATVKPGLLAAGDYVEGPYPATLEGAVRSGHAAAQRALRPGAK